MDKLLIDTLLMSLARDLLLSEKEIMSVKKGNHG
jgi:hypothetical protein